MTIRALRWAQAVLLCAIGIALAAAWAASAGATDHAPGRVERHHLAARTARQAHARLSGCGYADQTATSASASEMRAAVVCLINQQRTMRGLPSLDVSAKLNRSAQVWNQWMVSKGNFTHGSDFASRISAVGYDWQTAGENIATGFATPRSVVNAWMASPEHCRNILDPSFRDVGTGVTEAAVGTWATQPATWTQDFGLVMSQNSPSGKTGPQNGCPY